MTKKQTHKTKDAVTIMNETFGNAPARRAPSLLVRVKLSLNHP